MTVLTQFHTGRMSGALAGGYGVVVAVDTGVTGLVMPERYQCRAPDRIGVAQLARFSSNGVRRRFIGPGTGAVVTPGTVTRRRGFIVRKRYDQRGPHRGVMTGIALFTGQRMAGRFVRRTADPVMTSAAVTGLPRYTAVIEYGTQPGGGAVAGITGQGRGYVGGAFAGGNATVMTVLTHIRGLAVVKGRGDRGPVNRCMTGLAVVIGQRMGRRFEGAGTGVVMTTGGVTRGRGLGMVKRTD